MVTTIGGCAIEVSDLDRASRFYQEAFGLTVRNTIELPGIHEVVLGAADGGSALMLAQRDDHGPVVHGASFWKVYLNVDDAAAAHDRAVELGATSQRAPEELDTYPVTIAFVEDLVGYSVELISRR